MAQDAPTGIFIRRRSEKLIDGILCQNLPFKKEYPFPLSCVSTDWLAFIERDEGISIQHIRNGGEFKIDNKLYVDGYCASTNTVYQFHGCW